MNAIRGVGFNAPMPALNPAGSRVTQTPPRAAQPTVMAVEAVNPTDMQRRVSTVASQAARAGVNKLDVTA